MTDLILVINAGSSSLKYALFSRSMNLLSQGTIDRIGQSDSVYFRQFGTKRYSSRLCVLDHQVALRLALAELKRQGIRMMDIRLVGHRVVHGGNFDQPEIITKQVLKTLDRLSELAPLHQPANLTGIRIASRLLPHARPVAVFDTSFFADLPAASSVYPIDRAWAFKQAYRRHGFHGTSHDWASRAAAHQLSRPLKKINLITLHLGAGCSATAIRRGRPIDTSMGLTPLEGLMMASRGGDIDPGLILKLLKDGLKVDKIDYLLNYKSGWYGLTGLEDLRDVLTVAGHRPAGWQPKRRQAVQQQKKSARLALDIFVYRITKYIGAYAALLGRVDALVFTGAIGSGNPFIRQMIRQSSPLIRKMKYIIVPTDEERAIAEAARRVN